MRARKVDQNHSVIVRGLRALGFSVLDLSGVGRGCVDLIAARNGKNYMVEVKRDNKAKLTPAQVKFHASWKGKISVVRSIEDLENL